jgi:hypothetical protein
LDESHEDEIDDDLMEEIPNLDNMDEDELDESFSLQLGNTDVSTGIPDDSTCPPE